MKPLVLPPLWVVRCEDSNFRSYDYVSESRSDALQKAREFRETARYNGYIGVRYSVVRYVPAPKKRRQR